MICDPKIQGIKKDKTKHSNNDNNLFIHEEEESLAVKNTETEGDFKGATFTVKCCMVKNDGDHEL